MIERPWGTPPAQLGGCWPEARPAGDGACIRFARGELPSTIPLFAWPDLETLEGLT